MSEFQGSLNDPTFSIGVDLGGTNLRVAAFDGESVLDSILLPTRLSTGPRQVVQDMCEAIQSLVLRDSGGRRFIGVGIGLPGPLELPDGILRNPPNLPGWDGFNFRDAVESTLGYPVEIEGDANVAALAEAKLGAGKTYGIESLCILTLGTGVGSGLVLDGKIWHGSTGMGGEAGHIVVQPSGGPPCGCGGSGCLEQFASATAIARLGQERMPWIEQNTAYEIAQLAYEGNAKAKGIFDTVGQSLGIALTALINTLNLPLYLIGGGASDGWDLFSRSMFSDLLRRSYVYRLTEPAERTPTVLERHRTYVLQAELGSNAGLLGACLLPFQSVSDTDHALAGRR